MDKDTTSRTTCRLCGGTNLELAVPFVATPPGDAFISKDKLHIPQQEFSLDIYFCHGCASVQMRDVVNPEILFGGYTYKTSSSLGMRKHFEEYADMVLKHHAPEKGALVVEVGSNDGVLLRNFKDKGYRVLGIDPAKEIADEATRAGIETVADFFTPAVASSIKKRVGSADIVTANNVFAHVDDMDGIIKGVRDLMGPDAIFVFEASYVVDVVDNMLLGAIFHEHLCHHGLVALTAFFNKHGLEMFHVERVPIQGGSIIGFVQLKGGKRKPSAALTDLVAMEKQRGFDKIDIYKQFSRRIMDLRGRLRALLSDLKSKGKKIAGFGAARAGATLIYLFGLADFIEFIVDDNKEKHGLFSPGKHIPVFPTAVIYEKKPDYLFLLAWVHAKPIVEKNQAFLDQGGHFIVAHPRLEIF